MVSKVTCEFDVKFTVINKMNIYIHIFVDVFP